MPSFVRSNRNPPWKSAVQSRRSATRCSRILHSKWFTSPRYLIVLCQLFGVAPANINTPDDPAVGDTQRRHLLTSGAHIAYSASLLCAMCFCSYAQYQSFVFTLTPITRFLICVEYAFNVINCTFIIVGANVQRSRYDEYDRLLDSIERRLRRPTASGAANDNGVAPYLRLFYGACVLLVIVLCVIIIQFNETKLGMLYGLATYFLPNMMVMLTMGKYYGCMIIVRQRFGWLVECLRELDVNVDDNLVGHASDGNMKGGIPKNMFVLEFNTATSATASFNQSARHFERLNELRDIYHDLCRLSRAFNRSFGWLLIGVLTSAVFIITGQLYSIYHHWALGESPVLVYFHAIVWACKHFATVTIALAVNSLLDAEVDIVVVCFIV